MCPYSYIAYTGPYKGLEHCPICGLSWYNENIFKAGNGKQKVPAQHFYTLPIGVQIQAQWHSPKNAKKMEHQYKHTEEILSKLRANGNIMENYNDTYCGTEYLEACN